MMTTTRLPPMTPSVIDDPHHLVQLLALSGMGLWRYDHRLKRLEADAGVLAAFGGAARSPELPLGLAELQALIHAPDWPGVHALVCRQDGLSVAQTRFRVRGAHGDWTWLQGQSMVAATDEQGHVLLTVGTLSDVTEAVHHETHERLQHNFSEVVVQSPDRDALSRAMLRTVLDLSELDGGGLYWRLPDGGYQLIASQGLSDGFVAQVQRITAGSPRAQVIGAGDMVCEFADTEASHAPTDLLQAPALQAESIVALVVLPIRVNGQVLACMNLASTHTRWLPDATTALLRSLSGRFGLSIERLLAREESLNQQRNLEGFFQTLKDFVFVLDDQARIVYFNPAVRELLGYDHNLLGQTALQVHPTRSHGQAQTVLAAIQAGEDVPCPLPLVAADGREVMVDTRITHGLWNGQPALLCVSRDISDRMRMEAELEREHSLMKTLVNAMPDLFWVKDPKGVYLACNKRFESLYGHTAAEIVGKTDHDFVDAELADFFRQHDLAAMAKGGPSINEERIRFASDGHEEMLETIKTPVRNSQGTLLGVMGLGRDITQRAQAETQRTELLERLQKIARHVPGLIYQYHLHPDGSASIPYASPGIRDIFGTTPEAVLADASPVLNTIHPEDAPLLGQAILDSAQTLQPWVRDFRVNLPNGTQLWVHGHATPERLDDGGTLWHGYARDITAERAAREQLLLSASVFRHSYDGIIVTDANSTIVEVNPAFSRITGYSAEDVTGKSPSLLSSGRQGPTFYRSMWASLAEQDHWSGELWNRRKDGELFAENLSIAAVRNDEGECTHYLGVFSDITRLKTHEADLARIAQYDVLTGAPNRRLLGDRMKVALAHARRDKLTVAICMLDLDGFKEVNDSLGHAAGDELLVAIARRLEQALREGDTLARLGGDEFVLLFSDLQHPEQSRRVLDRVLQSVAQPLHLSGTQVSVTASIGITLFPADDVDADTLLRHADQAMYAAKQAGRNRFHFFDAEQDRMLHAHRDQFIRLEAGMARGELVLHYQPKVNLRTGEVLGAEALVRWQHPEQGLLTPGDFLHLVSGSHLEMALGRWVMHTALTQAVQWQQQQRLNLHLSINISAVHLLSPEFLKELQQALADHPSVDPGHLELEMLESAAIQDMGRASTVLSRCHQLGVQLALDDFGTGYSSLAYFRNLRVDTIKIDQSFVRDMLHDASDLGIVDSVIRLSDAFNRPVIAEGVETLKHGAVLLILGCERAQGYGVSRPMPANDVPGWIAHWQETQPWTQLPSVHVPRDKLALYAAQRSHEDWIAHITRLAERGMDGAETATPSSRCLFGQWYASSGAARFSRTPGFTLLGPLHEHVHAAAHELLAMAPSAPPALVQRHLASLHAASQNLTQALEKLMAD
jgi:diguanylate cyclase (GGDEF)-like protein/PAS domain S-box-containing protein